MHHVVVAPLHENLWWSGGKAPCNLNRRYTRISGHHTSAVNELLPFSSKFQVTS